MTQTIGVTMVSRNDLPFLKRTIPAALSYASQLAFVDNASTDGTKEWIESLNDPRIIYIPAVEYTIETLGFSHLKNVAANCLTTDWIHSLDADEMLSPHLIDKFPDIVTHTLNHVISVETVTFHGKLPPNTDWETIRTNDTFDTAIHRRVYRNRTGIDWKGYIHEELYRGEANCQPIAADKRLVHLHYTNYRDYVDPVDKLHRYYFMLYRAATHHDDSLRRYTNGWWYNNYVLDNWDRIVECKNHHLKMHPELAPLLSSPPTTTTTG